MKSRQPRRPDQQYSEQETIRRRDDAVKRALSTPPKPLKERIAEHKAKRGPKDAKKP